MRSIRILFALLCTLGGNAFAANKLNDYGGGGQLPFPFYIAQCNAAGTICGAVKHVPVGQAFLCTDTQFQRPAGVTTTVCYGEQAPAVAANPLPVWGTVVAVPLPAGVTKLVDKGGQFPTTAPTYAALCTSNALTCTTKRLFPATGGLWNCTEASANFGTLAGSTACFSFPVPAPTYSDVCLPEGDVNTATEFSVGAAPFADYPGYVVWRGKPACGSAVRGQLFTFMEGLQFAVSKAYDSDSKVNAWGRAQPVTVYTAEQSAFLKTRIDSYAASLPPRGTTTVPTMAVQSVSAACDLSGAVTTACTRPVYKKSATGTLSTAIPGVRVRGGVACDPAQRIGATSYYFVSSAGGYAVCVVKP